jgi:uncharacterized protein
MGEDWDFAISGSKIRQYVVCERLPYMEAFADEVDAIEQPTRDVALQIGVEHEASVATSHRWRAHEDVPAPPVDGNATQAAKWTLNKMREGVPRIAGGVLRDGFWWGAPDWLVRTEGSSKLGAWHYEVEDAKAGSKKRSRRFHTLPVAYYSLLLERVQGRRPTHFTLHRFDGAQRLLTDDFEADVLKVLEPLEWILGDTRDPGPHLNSECAKCPWENACRREAEGAKDLSLISGMRRTTRIGLKELDIRSLQDLAKESPSTIEHLPYLRPSNAARRAIEQARAYLDGIPRVAGTPVLSRPAKVELFIDFEGLGETNRDDAFMFGLLARQDGRTSYRPFVAETRRDIRRAWNAFVELVRTFQPEAPIFHYGGYERQILRGMAKPSDASFIGKRLIDLAPLVRGHAAVPRHGFSLKTVAESVGFHWRDDDADGWLARIWWEDWLRSGRSAPLRRLQRYNSDDLRATLLLRDWLVAFSGRKPTHRSLRSLARVAMKTAGRRSLKVVA